MAVAKTPRQAVVIVHGMGEQRPLEALNRFIGAAIPETGPSQGDDEQVRYYSRPDQVADSYESRRYLAPATDRYAQTEFFEYHWAHLMQGNMLSDMWATLRRMLLQWPWRVPVGLRGIWIIFWIFIAVAVWFFLTTDITFGVNELIAAVVGGGLVGTVLTWGLTKFLPGKISSTFVDVVRYLDTSPRSYGVRKAIRAGMIDLLKELHRKGRYQRIVVVAHSLGAYVAYDGITYLWTEMNHLHLASQKGRVDPDVIRTLENEARKLLAEDQADPGHDKPSDPTRFRAAQRALWKQMRKQGCPWLITDFVTAGTPMYMADLLMTRSEKDFDEKKRLRQIAACPPLADLPGPTPGKTLYSYPYDAGTVLYHAAPFAVVRWTNMWFPAHWSFFGDWFGGPLQRLFGRGIEDIALQNNGWRRFVPAGAHTNYFKFAGDESEESVTRKLHVAMDLDSKSWLADTLDLESAEIP